METNEKLIAVVEIGGDKATQFWARADDLAQAYNEKSTDIVYSVKKLPDSDNLFHFFATSKEGCTILNSADGQTLELEKQNCNDLLSDREKEILQLINKGKMSKDIAQTLSISLNTVNRHRQNILEKLQVNNSIEACRIAKELHLL